MDEKKLNKVLTAVAFVISIVGLIISIRIMIGYEDVVGTAITMTIILMAIAAGVAVLFGLYQLLTNIKRNVSLLAGIVGFVIIGFVCYSLASDEVMRTYVDISPTTSKLSGGGLLFMYVLLVGATFAAIIGEVTRIFK